MDFGETVSVLKIQVFPMHLHEFDVIVKESRIDGLGVFVVRDFKKGDYLYCLFAC